MPFPSFPYLTLRHLTLRRHLLLHIHLAIWILNTLFVVLLAVVCTSRAAVADSPPLHSATKSQKTRVAIKKSGGKLSKYDVDHIGQRGVGAGINLYSAKRERELGQSLAAKLDGNTKFVNDPIIIDYINLLGQKIVRNSDAEAPFTIKIIDSDDIRAFGLPGGFLYVDSGLIIDADGEAELAGVMAHEIAHVAARHATRTVTRKDLWNLLGALALFAGPVGVDMEEIGGIAGPLSVKKFSRDAEYEADLLGIQYAYAAGYDPEAFVLALEKLQAREAKIRIMFTRVPGYHLASKVPFHSQIVKGLSNYPFVEERIRRIRGEISSFLPSRRDYVLDTSEFQEARRRLLATEAPVLRRHHPGEDNEKGPILRRRSQQSVDGIWKPFQKHKLK